MSWKQRDKQIRRLQALHDNIDNDLQYLKDFSDLYKQDHLKLSLYAEAIAGMLIEVQGHTLKLKEQL